MFPPVTSLRVGPTLQVELDLMPAPDPNVLDRRRVVDAIAQVRRQLRPPVGLNYAQRLVPLGDVLLQLAQACGLIDLEVIEALGAELVAELCWPEEPQP